MKNKTKYTEDDVSKAVTEVNKGTSIRKASFLMNGANKTKRRSNFVKEI